VPSDFSDLDPRSLGWTRRAFHLSARRRKEARRDGKRERERDVREQQLFRDESSRIKVAQYPVNGSHANGRYAKLELQLGRNRPGEDRTRLKSFDSQAIDRSPSLISLVLACTPRSSSSPSLAAALSKTDTRAGACTPRTIYRNSAPRC